MSRDSADRQLGFLAPAMASEELRLVQPQRMENGSSSRMLFGEDSIRFPLAGGCVDHRKSHPACGFVMEGNKLFPNDKGEVRLFQNQEAALRRRLYVSPERIERDEGNARSRGWNVEGNGVSGSRGDGSDGDGDEDEEDDVVDDDELDEGDGEVDGLVSADLGNANKNSNNSSGSMQSSSEKICNDKANVQEHHSCFGLSRTVLTKCGNDMSGNSGKQHHHCEGGNNYENAITVVEPELFCSQIFHGGDGPTAAQKSLGDNGYGFSGRREGSFPVYPGESLRAHLSDPVTGTLMDDAIILPCGHSFGSGGMQHVQRIKACFKCSVPISEDSVRPNLALRAAVQAFLREEESHSCRLSKRRRDRFELDKYKYDDQLVIDSRNRGVQFPFNVSDRVIIKGNKRTPQRFVGRMAVVTTQCLNGWYVVKTLDSAESVKLQYRSLSKVPEDSSNFTGNKPITSNWL